MTSTWEVQSIVPFLCLQVAPVLQQGMNSRVAYFPQGRWYSLYDYTLVDATSGGKNQTVQVCLRPLTSSNRICSDILCGSSQVAGLRLDGSAYWAFI